MRISSPHRQQSLTSAALHANPSAPATLILQRARCRRAIILKSTPRHVFWMLSRISRTFRCRGDGNFPREIVLQIVVFLVLCMTCSAKSKRLQVNVLNEFFFDRCYWHTASEQNALRPMAGDTVVVFIFLGLEELVTTNL
jgi:hypothetical protein